MSKGNYVHAGFWLAIGLSLGMLISNITQGQRLEAGGSTSFNEEYRMVTGTRSDTQIDVVWLLDYKAAILHCIMLDQRSYKLSGIVKLDLMEQLEIPEGTKARPKFMMVTGFFSPQSTDVCYVAETSTGQLLCVFPPYALGRASNRTAAQLVVDRFNFREAGAVRKN